MANPGIFPTAILDFELLFGGTLYPRCCVTLDTLRDSDRVTPCHVKPRLDIAGALHHIIVRGTKKSAIFYPHSRHERKLRETLTMDLWAKAQARAGAIKD